MSHLGPLHDQRLSAAGAAHAITILTADNAPDRQKLRVVYQLNDDLHAATDPQVCELVDHAPRATGDRRYDAFIAALVHWHTCRRTLPTPIWVHDPNRRIDPPWQIDPHTDPADIINVIARYGIHIGRAELTPSSR